MPGLRGNPHMLYPDLFKAFESVRWSLDRDVPWQAFDRDL
jgi:hypothetical protein